MKSFFKKSSEYGIKFLKIFKGISKSRKDVFSNYQNGTIESNKVYLFLLSKNNETKYLVYDKNNDEFDINIFEQLHEVNEFLEKREFEYMDINDELYLFNIKAEGYINENMLNSNYQAEVIKNYNDEWDYSFNIYANDELISENLTHIYNFDFKNLKNDVN